MFFTLLCFTFIIKVSSEEPPGPPQNVHVEKWLLTWTPVPEDRDVTFTVQYRNFNNAAWKNVTACVQIPSSRCNVTLAGAEDEHGCMMLRVRADRRGRTSEAVQACSRLGDSCTPGVRLSARAGSLTVHLMGNHSLATEYGAHAQHRVFYGKEGGPLTDYEDRVSSVTIHHLQEGQRYCVMTQYLLFNKPVGPPSCVYCELIPESYQKSKQAWIVAGVVLVIPVLLTPVLFYLFMFRCGRFKKWLRSTRYSIPSHFLEDLSPEDPVLVFAGSPEEHFDVVTIRRSSSSRTLQEPAEQRSSAASAEPGSVYVASSVGH